MRRQSFENVDGWLRDVRASARSEAVMTVIGNKAALVEERGATTEEAEELVLKCGLMYFETSSRTRQNREKCMMACQEAMEKLIDEGTRDGTAGCTVSL
jgi:GTPase SAR1 family protein